MLFKRLLVTYILIIVIPLSIVAGFASYISTRILNKEIYTSIEQTISQSERNISGALDSALGTLYHISMNNVIQYNLKKPSSNTPFEIGREVTSIRNTLLYPGIFNRSYSSVEIYALNKKYYPQVLSQNDVMSSDIVKNKDWYERVLKLKGKPYWHVNYDFKKRQVSVKRLIFDVSDYTMPLAIGSVDIDTSIFQGILENVKFGKTSKVFFIDNNGNIIAPGTGTISFMHKLNRNVGVSDISNNGNRAIAFYNTVWQTGWKIVEVIPYSELVAKSRKLNNVIIAVGILCVIIAIILSFYISYSISHPISVLAKTIDNVKEGDLNLNLVSRNKGEIGILYKSYNSMINRINKLIKEVYIANMEKKDAELKALQAQMNPHFLYNTLDSINWLAVKYKTYDISKMVTSLATLLRYSINQGKDMIKVDDELKQVNSYITIQKVRYKDKFDVTYEIDDNIRGCRIIKLVLQPLVENAIIHGLETYEGKGYILIKGYKNGNSLILKVENNGKPIDLSKVNDMLKEERFSEHYGIKNVNDRIRSTFGEQYGLAYDYIDGKTIAILTIPYIREE